MNIALFGHLSVKLTSSTRWSIILSAKLIGIHPSQFKTERFPFPVWKERKPRKVYKCLFTDSFALIPDSEISHVKNLAIQESGIPFVYFHHFLRWNKSNCTWAEIRTSCLLKDPYRVQSDALAFLAMDPGFQITLKVWGISSYKMGCILEPVLMTQ